MERLLWSNWMERLLCASLLLVGLVPGVRAVELEVKGAKDVTLATGAEFRDKPLARSGGTGALIRSGNPNDHSTATVIEPSPDPIKRVQLDIEYLIGFESDGVPPVLSVWVQDTPDPTAPGGKQVYESGKDSPPLKCDTKAKRHCYSTCDDKDQRDCYSPAISVDAVCPECTGKYVSLRFANNAMNVQVLLPLTISINEKTQFISYIVDFSALFVGMYLLIGATVSVYHGKRGWHVIPHADHIRSLAGLVQDGVTFSTASLRGQTSEPLLGAKAAGTAQAAAAGDSGADGGGRKGQLDESAEVAAVAAAVATGQRTALHAAAAVGDAARVQRLLEDGAPGAVDAPDTRGFTAFHVACAGGHAECVVALCKAGSRTDIKNDVGLTGWELAGELHRKEVLALDRVELETVAEKVRAHATKRAERKGKAGSSSKRKKEAKSPRAPKTAPAPALAPAPAAAQGGGAGGAQPKTVLL